MAFHPFGSGVYTLGSSISSTQNTITLSSFTEPVSGVPYTMVLLNTSIVYGTIAPKTNQSEFISFTGITQNANGTATLTGVVRGLEKKYPFTANATFQLPHSGQTPFIISNPPQLYEEYAAKKNTESITGIWTYGTGATPLITDTPTTNLMAANKAYVDATAIFGAPDASDTTKGISQMSAANGLSLGPVGVAVSKGVCTMTIATPAVVTNAGHGLVAGDIIRFSTTGGLANDLSANVNYFVIAAGLGVNTFQFSATDGGAAYATGGAQSGVHTLYKMTNISIASPCVISLTAHGLNANDTIQLTTDGALPTGLTAGTTYYVISTGLTANAFQVSSTLGGSAINTSGTQSGTHTLRKTTPVALSNTDTNAHIIMSAYVAANLDMTGFGNACWMDPISQANTNGISVPSLIGLVVPFDCFVSEFGVYVNNLAAVSVFFRVVNSTFAAGGVNNANSQQDGHVSNTITVATATNQLNTATGNGVLIPAGNRIMILASGGDAAGFQNRSFYIKLIPAR